jgi:hypothetical protein
MSVEKQIVRSKEDVKSLMLQLAVQHFTDELAHDSNYNNSAVT